MVAIHASLLPEGFVPTPAMVKPSADMPLGEFRFHPVMSMPWSIRICLRACIPFVSSQTNASLPEEELLPPTTTEPSAETAKASL